MSAFVFAQKKNIAFGYFPSLEQYGVVHAFTLRTNGESDIIPGTLNMALHVGDDPQKVLSNRQKVAAALEFDLQQVTTCEQVHGNKVEIVTPELRGSGALDFATTVPQTDGLVCAEHNVVLMLFFADCVPVMLVDTKSKAFGLVHAGWRGAVSDIAARAVLLLQERFGTKSQDVVAVMGPSIGPCCYEVDEAVYAKAQAYKECFRPSTKGHWHLDLWQVNRQQLRAVGVPEEQILSSAYCTYEHTEKYFSYRAEKGRTGRLAAVIYRK